MELQSLLYHKDHMNHTIWAIYHIVVQLTCDIWTVNNVEVHSVLDVGIWSRLAPLPPFTPDFNIDPRPTAPSLVDLGPRA